MFSASAMPTAALVPVVSPDDVVFEVAFVVALSEAAPVPMVGGPGLMVACVATLLIAIAMAGAAETPPPDAPVFASVVMVFVVAPDSVSAPVDRPSVAFVPS